MAISGDSGTEEEVWSSIPDEVENSSGIRIPDEVEHSSGTDADCQEVLLKAFNVSSSIEGKNFKFSGHFDSWEIPAPK